ncbi:hypothetical protein [Burkholderia sp. Ax-1724]|uniref:hypothetical protein n=1 Tax=Burkholderia sp. Ax-1724 TaxID=2608336 RepID=UPI00141F9A8E|nr:hypothetical protein [Burkholderia sp. Ax-1724]NIF51426.1 hypothetical protein [Burkholderia sp. Ax-1724]
MSLVHEVVAWDFDMPGLKKIVMLQLARSAHRASQEASLPIHKVTSACGISESAARKYIAELAREGYIAFIPAPGRGVHYRLTIDSRVPA